MSADDAELRRLIEDLSVRLDRVERELRLPSVPPRPVPTQPLDLTALLRRKQAAEAMPSAPIPLIPPTTPPPRSAPPTSPPPVEPDQAISPVVFGTGSFSPRPTVARPPLVSEPRSNEPVPQTNALERFVGGRLLAVLGALAVVIAFGMFFKLALDRGWLAAVTPVIRCTIGGLAGLAMMGAGEIVRRKLGEHARMAHAGITGAGLAVVYASALAAHGYFKIIGATAAFPMLAAISALGIGVALLSRSLPLAILSLVCAYLNPFLMQNAAPTRWVWPSYLLSLMVLGLVLAGWRPNPFRALRSVVWWGTVLVGTTFILVTRGQWVLDVLVFLGLVWLLVHAELWIGCRREPEARLLPFSPRDMRVRITRPMVLSFASTAWCVTTGILVVQFTQLTGVADWMVPAAGVVGTLISALMLAGNLRVLADQPETDAERLGAALWMQAGGLIIVTVALGVSNWTQTVAWLGMGIAAIAAGRWVGGKSLQIYGLTLMCIGTARMVIWDSWHTGGPTQPLLGLHVGYWSLLMLICGASWLASAAILHMSNAGSARRTVTNVCIGLGLTLPFVGLVSQHASISSLIVATSLLALAVLAAARFRLSALLDAWGFFVLLLTTVLAMFFQATRVGKQDLYIDAVASTNWTPILAVLASVGVVGAWLARRPTRVALSVALVALAAAAGALSPLAPDQPLGWPSVVCVVIGAGLCAATLLTRRHFLDVIGMAAFACAILYWLGAYTVQEWWLDSHIAPLAHPGLWIALLIVSVLGVTTWWLLRGPAPRASFQDPAKIGQWTAGVVLFIATSFEVSRSATLAMKADPTAQAATLSIWWGVFAVGLLILGFVRVQPVVRHVGLALLMIAAGKAALFDLAEVKQEWRIVSFLGLGLLMLGVSVAYAKVSARLKPPAHAPTPIGTR